MVPYENRKLWLSGGWFIVWLSTRWGNAHVTHSKHDDGTGEQPVDRHKLTRHLSHRFLVGPCRLGLQCLCCLHSSCMVYGIHNEIKFCLVTELLWPLRSFYTPWSTAYDSACFSGGCLSSSSSSSVYAGYRTSFSVSTSFH